MPPPKQQTFLEKYWSQIALLFFMIICIIQCNNNGKLQTSYSSLDNDAKMYQASAMKYLEENKKLRADIPKYDDSIKAIRIESRKKDIKIEQLKIAVQAKVEHVKAYNSIDIQNYLVDRYKLKPIDIPIVQQGVIFKDTVSRLVITELVKYDGTKAQLEIVSGKLKDEQKINYQLELKNDNLEIQNENSMLAISKKDQAFNAKAKEVVEEKNKTTTERNKKSFWQITTGVIAVVATTLLITK